MRILFAMILVLVGSPAFADWITPARGTETRQALMDALRPHAEYMLGAPVEFVVNELRQTGDLAFAMVDPQRPGGAQISIVDTPAYARGALDPAFDHLGMQALYRKSGDTWVAVHWALGATDVWFIAPELCAEYLPVIADFCAFEG